MKVLFIARSTLFTNRGGDTIQILNTAKHLEKLGIHTQIRLSNDHIDYDSFDLLHFFNITRPADILYHIRKSAKPYVISTIFVDYSEFERKMRKGIGGLAFKYLSPGFIEYTKTMARAIVNGEKIMSPEYFWMGQERAIKKIIKHARLLLPNSHNEYKRLALHFKTEHRYMPIPNAIDPDMFTPKPATRDEKMVLCVGRIEGLKNQLNLIRAVNNSEFRLVIIGEPATNHMSYFEQCKKEAADNIKFEGSVSQSDLVHYYSMSKVHVLPSWFETTGLSSLEAAAMGNNIVITDKGDTREYFGELAFYCEPDSTESILKAIRTAAATPVDGILQKMIRTRYTWTQTAEKTAEAYRMALSEPV